MNSTELKKIASILVREIQTILKLETVIVAWQGVIIASNQSENIGQSIKTWKQANSNYLEIPFDYQEELGTVVLIPLEAISPNIAEKIISYVVKQSKVENLEQQQELIKNVLKENNNEAETLKPAKTAGLDLSLPRAVILVEVENNARHTETANHRVITQLIMSQIAEFFGSAADPICINLDNTNIAAFKICNSASLATWVDDSVSLNSSLADLGTFRRTADRLVESLRNNNNLSDRHISVSIGRHYPGLVGLKQSYQEAYIALKLGRYFNSQNNAYCIDRLGISGFIQICDQQTKLELAQSILAPLDNEPALLATVEAFLNLNCSPVASSKQLAIHRNTLRYRLDKVHSLIGLDPRQFDDAVQIRLALQLRQLQPDTTKLSSIQ